jgi:hypothetical protein
MAHPRTMNTNILYLLLPISIAWFGVLLRQAFEMEKERRYQRMWGTIAWSLFPFGVSAVVWVHQGDADVLTRNILLGVMGATFGASLFIWIGYIFSGSGTMAAVVTASPPVASVMTRVPVSAPADPIAAARPLPSNVIRELLDALTEAKKMVDETISPPLFTLESQVVNWRGMIPNNGVNGFAQRLTESREKIQTTVWPAIDTFLASHSTYKRELSFALALEEEAARGEVIRALDVAIADIKRLPENASPETQKLVEPQLQEVHRQIQPPVYKWIGTARTRIDQMAFNLRHKGITGFEKELALQ